MGVIDACSLVSYDWSALMSVSPTCSFVDVEKGIVMFDDLKVRLF